MESQREILANESKEKSIPPPLLEVKQEPKKATTNIHYAPQTNIPPPFSFPMPVAQLPQFFSLPQPIETSSNQQQETNPEKIRLKEIAAVKASGWKDDFVHERSIQEAFSILTM